MTEPFERTPGGAILMDGERLRDEIVAQLRATIEAAGSPPVCLATVLVGDDRPSQIYVRNKGKKAEEAAMISRHVGLGADASQAEVEDAVAALAADPGVHGILCQLPLPDGLDAERVLGAVPAGEGRRRAHRTVDGTPRARPTGSRAVHAARRDALARPVRHCHERQARRGGRDVPRSSGCHRCCCSAARASTRRSRSPIHAPRIWSRCVAVPTSSWPPPVQLG